MKSFCREPVVCIEESCQEIKRNEYPVIYEYRFCRHLQGRIDMWKIDKADIASFFEKILSVAFFRREMEECAFFIETAGDVHGFTECYGINEDDIVLDQEIEKCLMVMARDFIGITLMGKGSRVQKDEKEDKKESAHGISMKMKKSVYPDITEQCPCGW